MEHIPYTPVAMKRVRKRLNIKQVGVSRCVGKVRKNLKRKDLSVVMGGRSEDREKSAFSLRKRGIYGMYHQVSIKHLGRYCNEFSYRFNRRAEQLQMLDSTLKNLPHGEALPYAKLTASAESEAF